jgi:tight adherence protein B
LALSPLLPKPSNQSLLVAGIAARLAVFMGAGLSPTRSWQELVDADDESAEAELIREVNDRVGAGASLVAAVAEVTQGEDDAWRVLAATHTVAHDTGAPLGEALWALSTALGERYDAERAVRATILAPIYTQRLLMGLPVLGLVVSAALGVNALGFLTSSALGWGLLVVAAVLMVVAWRWSRHMIRQALPGPGFLSPALDLLAIATSGGASPEVARNRVEGALIRHSLDSPESTTLDRLPALSRRVGIPLRALAVAEASWSRARVKADASEKAAALSVKILIPLGVLVLPAFVIVGVIPVVFALLSGVFGAGGEALW